MEYGRVQCPLLPHHPLAACPQRLDLLSVSAGYWVHKMLAMINCFVPVVASGDLVYPEVSPPFIQVDDSPWPGGQRDNMIVHALFVSTTGFTLYTAVL